MTPPAAWTTELDVLLERLIEGSFTADDRARLNVLLAQGEEPRRYYRGYMKLHHGLEWRIGEPTFQANLSLPPTRPSLPNFAGVWSGGINFLANHPMAQANIAATLIVGIAILAASVIPMPHYRQPIGQDFAGGARSSAGEKSSVQPEPEIVSIARISGMVDCRWVDAHQAPAHNKIKLHDKFALVSGLMEITYHTGARVILQGPCTYEVESASGGYLSLGKLTARVEKKEERGEGRGESKNVAGNPPSALRLPPSSSPQPLAPSPSSVSSPLSPLPSPLFAVRTPTALVTDLGTEFGVEVSRKGHTLSHVFQGRVTVRFVNTKGVAVGREVTLDEGQSARLAADADPKEPIVVVALGNTENSEKVATTDFVRKIQAKTQVADSTDYAKAVLADKPLFYWNFDESAGWAIEQVRHLRHQALLPEMSATRCSHASIGSGLKLGRAADFSRDAGCFRALALDHGKIPGAWAIEFWVQFTGNLKGYTKQYILNLGIAQPLGDANEPAVIFDWGMLGGADNELELYNHFAGRTTNGPQINDNRWHHLVMIFYGDGEKLGVASRVDIVLNGTRRTVERNGFSTMFDLGGELLVGTDTPDLISPFHGRLDELAFYDLSGLSVKQLEAKISDMARRHIAAARPSQDGAGN